MFCSLCVGGLRRLWRDTMRGCLLLLCCCCCLPALLCSGWLDTWRRYLQAALARKQVTQLPAAPEPLPEVISALMCTCHPPEQPLLAVPLPVVVNKRGR